MNASATIGIIGMGHVGAHVANSLLLQGLAGELLLCDISAQKVASEVQDLRDSLAFCPYNVRIENCGDRYEELSGCDIIVNAAGNVALAAENRDGELFFTTDAARTFAERVVSAGFQGIWVSIANPCDVVCTEIWHLTGYDPKKIIGSGTGLDSARLRSQISLACGGLDPKSIDAYMIGEHGASQLAAWTAASISGKPLSELEAEHPERFSFDHTDIEEKARVGGLCHLRRQGLHRIRRGERRGARRRRGAPQRARRHGRLHADGGAVRRGGHLHVPALHHRGGRR